jgi:hypothetical protein
MAQAANRLLQEGADAASPLVLPALGFNHPDYAQTINTVRDWAIPLIKEPEETAQMSQG